MKIQGSWESSTCSNEAGPAADWWRLLQRETAPARLLGQPSGGRRREQALLGLASNQRSMFFRVVLCMILCEQYQLRAEVRLFFHAILYVRKEYQVLLFFFFFFWKARRQFLWLIYTIVCRNLELALCGNVCCPLWWYPYLSTRGYVSIRVWHTYNGRRLVAFSHTAVRVVSCQNTTIGYIFEHCCWMARYVLWSWPHMMMMISHYQ